MATVKFWICELSGEVEYQDWNDLSDPGKIKTRTEVLERVVVNDSSDTLCIGAYGKNSKYLQYDSYEAYHAEGFFKSKYDEYGLEFRMYQVEADLDSLKIVVSQ